MVIRTLNIDKCLKSIENIQKVNLSRAFIDSGALVQGDAKKLAPVNKNPNAPTRGNLRASIRRTKLNGDYRNGVSVGTIVEYAPYPEFGTYKMQAQPFLIPALKQNQTKILKIITAEAQKQLGK